MSWGGTFGAPAAKVAPNNFGAPPAFGAPAAAQFGGARPTQGFGAAPAAAFGSTQAAGAGSSYQPVLVNAKDKKLGVVQRHYMGVQTRNPAVSALEMRCQKYIAGGGAPPPVAPPGGGAFGGRPAAAPFGAPAPAFGAPTAAPAFGAPAAAPAFGGAAPAFGAAAAAPAFGAAAPAFGAGAPAFGAAAPAFGAAAPAFGAAKPAFGAAPAFGGAAPAFGAAKPAFGAAAPFGGAKPAFGGAATAFGAAKPAFGGATATFGAKPGFGAGAPAFGASKFGAKPAFGAAAFGAAAPAFGGAKPAFGGTASFGGAQTSFGAPQQFPTGQMGGGQFPVGAQQRESLAATRRRIAGSDTTRDVVTLCERAARRVAAAAPQIALARVGGHSSPAVRQRALRSKQLLRLPPGSPGVRGASPGGSKFASIAEKLERARSSERDAYGRDSGGGSSVGAVKTGRLDASTLRQHNSPGGGMRGARLSGHSRKLHLGDQRGAPLQVRHVTSKSARRKPRRTTPRRSPAVAAVAHPAHRGGGPGEAPALLPRPAPKLARLTFATLSTAQLQSGYTTTPPQSFVATIEQRSDLNTKHFHVELIDAKKQWGARVTIPTTNGDALCALDRIVLTAQAETESKVPEAAWDDSDGVGEPMGLQKLVWLQVPAGVDPDEYRCQIENNIANPSDFTITVDDRRIIITTNERAK